MSEFQLTPALFSIFALLVEERTGLHYTPEDSALFSSKLLSRALDAGFDSPLDYYYRLRYDDPDGVEFQALTESLVVNETYFFREEAPLRILCDTFVRPRVERGERVRIWCAAAATGEEPLTLAMMLSDRGMLGAVDLVASDISPRAIGKARAGVYGRRSMRAIDDAHRSRWFTGDADALRVDPSLVAAVDWNLVNLTDDAAVAALGRFDIILCRNVLIYFSEGTVRSVASRLATSLTQGGALLVGASESLLRFGTLLTCEEHGGCFFYRRSP